MERVKRSVVGRASWRGGAQRIFRNVKLFFVMFLPVDIRHHTFVPNCRLHDTKCEC